MILDRICRHCGAAFKGGPRAWYCPDCRDKRKKEATIRYRRNGAARLLGSVDRCQICGGEYIVNSARQRYCQKCAPDKYKEVDRAQGLEYYEKNKSEINPTRNKQRRKTDIVCPICGNKFDANGTRAVCCSDKCRKEYINKKWLKRYYKKRAK